MKYLIAILLLCFQIGNVYAGDVVVKYSIPSLEVQGTWKDKSKPHTHHMIFKSNQDFTYKYKDYIYETHGTLNGVWETGGWTITTEKTSRKEPCNLMVYAGHIECCYDMRFIRKNMILSAIYSKGSSIRSNLCENKVMIKK